MKRREFFGSAAATACGYAALSGCMQDPMEQMMEKDSAYTNTRRGDTVARNPLRIPPVVSPNGLVLQSKLSASYLGGNTTTRVWCYNDLFPGPSLKAHRGETVSIRLENHLAEETITHWHGLVVDTPNDGQPHSAIAPGESYSYNFTIDQRAALNFYHPHPHMLTGKQVYFGQAGAFIVTDDEEQSLGLPSGTYEVPLVIRDATLDSTNNLVYKPRSGGFLGQMSLVNGTRDPYLAVDRTVYRFRVLNGANSRIFGLTLSNGATMTVIGNDGGLLESSSALARIDISNGERLDLLVDFRSYPAGTSIMLNDARSGWNLIEFRVGSASVAYSGPTAVTSSIARLAGPMRTRLFSFDGMSKINGKVYDMHRIDFQVPFGETELWRFATNGNAPHPVHVHGTSFQVISRTGGRGRLYPWEGGWKDTVLLEDQETVDVLIRFDGFRGNYLIHCHKLEHEDMGMMSAFSVV